MCPGAIPCWTSKPLPVRNGFFELTNEPSLGFDLVEEELEKHPGVTRRRTGFYV